MKTYIDKISLKGFKSFNKKSEFIFGPGMNCIIGANGSGKSNVLDALCFVLGRMSSKDLRADNFSELLFKKEKTAASEGDVVFNLDNKSKIFPIESKIVEVKRRIKKTGQTQYKLNGRNATRQRVLEVLSHAKVFPNAHNIILQGDVARFTEMKPVEKRQVIEEIAGINVYEERKNTTLKQLDKVEEKIKEVNIILTEKETYLKGLEQEKAEAEKFRSIKDELLSVQAKEIKLRTENALSKFKRFSSDIQKREKEINKLRSGITDSESKVNKLQSEISGIEKTIEKKGGEESLALQKSIETLKIDLEKGRNLISSSKNEINRIGSRKEALNNNFENLKEKVKEKGIELRELEKKMSALEKEEFALRKKAGIASNFKDLINKTDAVEKEIDELKVNKDDLSSQINKSNMGLNLLDSQVSSINEQLAGLKKDENRLSELKDNKKRYRQIIEDINRFANEDSKLALKLGDLRKTILKKEEEIVKYRINTSSSQEILLRDKSIKDILSQKGKIKGIHGTVSDLGEVNPDYATALKVAAGGRIKNIVVENSNVAIKCLTHLRTTRTGFATFLPLDKLRTPREERSIKTKPGVIGLAYDLITTSPKYKNLFKYIFMNTVIVKDVNAAKNLGIGKYQMVTLNGDLFSISGAITGGYRRSSFGVSFKQKNFENDLQKLENVLLASRREIRELEQRRGKLEVTIMNLRKEKSELEGRAELTKDISDRLDSRSGLNKTLSEVNTRKKALNVNIIKLEKEIGKVNEDISKKNALKASLKELIKKIEVAERSGKLRIVSDHLRDLDSKIAVIKSTIENSMLPDMNNISKVLKELEKEKSLFRTQISDGEAKIKTMSKELKVKEQEEKKFYGKLKSLFANKNKISNELKDLEKSSNELKLELNKAEQERNLWSVEKARYEAEVAKLGEEGKAFEKVKPNAELTNITDARKMVRKLEVKLESLGNVNLKALEVYEDAKEQYNKLSWRVTKLSSEKNDVLEVIDEIEKKKKDAFLKAYNEVSTNFDKLFNKISDKHKADISLENKEKPFEGGVVIRITTPKGKSLSLAALSGGEKVLVALAFIFAIQEHEPAPFYLLDEIDAALDKVNSEKVAKLLAEYSKKAQVIIISHNDAVISESTHLYGVSMNKTGESNIVSLKI